MHHNNPSALSFMPFKAGDKVSIVAPSGAGEEGIIEKAHQLLESWGLAVKVHSDLLGPNLLYANSDEKRFLCLMDAINDETVKGVWCLRGGSGAKRLIPLLRREKRPSSQKTFIGLSDITSLHTFLHQEWGWTTIHALTLSQMVKEQADQVGGAELKKILFGQQDKVIFNDIKALNTYARNLSPISYPLVGGNLAVLQYSIGTPWQLKAQDKILLLEDVNEKPYRIAEYLDHFKQAGVFEGLKSLLLADFTYDVPDQDLLLEKVLIKFASEVEFPVFRMTGIGHGPVSRPFAVGGIVTLNAQAQQLICYF